MTSVKKGKITILLLLQIDFILLSSNLLHNFIDMTSIDLFRKVDRLQFAGFLRSEENYCYMFYFMNFLYD